jgi:type I restriction enzyme M protein
MTRIKKETLPQTTAQSLSSIVKSARDIMRKDKGLNGDADRLPMLTWIMFLKFLDDQERIREDEAKLSGERFIPAIEEPYRWRDWAARVDGITGDELIAFINQDEATRPDGTRGAGLFAYLKNMQGTGTHDRRDTISAVFMGTVNRMINGYLLRDVLNKLEGIHFNSSEELHVLSRTYETLLKEMRDAAGDAGEFYTPRPVVKLMVELTDPRLGETILDPACGTGGFLVEAYTHLEKQCQTVKDRKTLQQASIQGGEAKPLPYLLCNMNLLLHGLDSPDIDPGNSLRFPLKEIGDAQRVDVILTNPPFGGEEERGILGNFPEDKQAAETTLLFMQLIMRKLRRQPKTGRAAVVVPNGTLYEEGISQRIRTELLTEFNLHTVIRLPKGVFEPYTDIATNILFFDRLGPTQHVWFYEHPLPERRAHLKGKSYSATDGVLYDEFRPLIAWWGNRIEDQCAWRLSAIDLLNGNVDLAQNHPRHANVEMPAPSQIITSVRKLKDESESILCELEASIHDLTNVEAPKVRLGELLKQRTGSITVQNDVIYRRPRVQLHFRGARIRDAVAGIDIGTKNQTVIHTNDLIVSKIDARNGAMAIVPSELDGAIATNDFPVFEIEIQKVHPAYLRYCLFQPSMIRVYEQLSRGSTNRRRLKIEKFLDLEIPLPQDIDIQVQVADHLVGAERLIKELLDRFGGMGDELGDLVGSALHNVFVTKAVKQ